MYEPSMPNPIFVMGSMRSGTTLLRIILDSHPHIALGWETGFARAIKHTKQVPDFIYGDRWYRRYGLTDEDMDRRLQAFYASIFESYASREGARRWGEKTPLNVFRVNDIANIFPDSQFIVTVRHPGAAAASLLKWNYDFDKALAYWTNVYDRLRSFMSDVPPWRLTFVRFEDLLTNPPEVLASIMQFLGEPWSDNLLRHHVIQPHKGVFEVEGNTRADRPLDGSRIGDWIKDLSREQFSAIEDVCEENSRHFGYVHDVALPQGPVHLTT